MKKLGLIACRFFSLLTVIAMSPMVQADAAHPDFNNDSELTQYLLRTDLVLSRVASSCQASTVSRSADKIPHVQDFQVKLDCMIKDNPEEDLDCPRYKIDVEGTIENHIHATARKIELTLVCFA